MPASKPINIDQILDEQFKDDDDGEIACHEVVLFEQNFRIREDLNAFNILQLGSLDDTAVIAKMMLMAVHPEDRPRFKSAIMTAERLSVPKLLKLFEVMVEVASGGHPTDSSSGSKGGTRKAGARQLSAGASSGRESTPTL